MDIRYYINKLEKTYWFKVRTLVALDDAAMTKIEDAIAHFDPVKISRPHKSILQTYPADFPQIESAEVWSVEMTLSVPCTVPMLSSAIKAALAAPESFVVVYTKNQPNRTYQDSLEAIADIDKEAAKLGLVPASLLSTAEDYPENKAVPASEVYGDAYNARLLDHLKQVEAKRKASIPQPRPFSYLNPSVVVAPTTVVSPSDKQDNFVDIDGSNIVHSPTQVKKVFFDKNGKTVVLSRLIETQEAVVTVLVDKLHTLLTNSDISDVEIGVGVNLSQKGQANVAKALNVPVDQVPLLLKQLAQRMRDRSQQEEDAWINESGDEDSLTRFGYEIDSQKNITIRDVKYGNEHMIRGSNGAKLIDELRHCDTVEEQQEIIALYFQTDETGLAKDDSARLSEDASLPKKVSFDPSSAIGKNSGTLDFPWKLKGMRGVGTAYYSGAAGAGNNMKLKILSLHNSDGKEIAEDWIADMNAQLLVIVKKYIKAMQAD